MTTATTTSSRQAIAGGDRRRPQGRRRRRSEEEVEALSDHTMQDIRYQMLSWRRWPFSWSSLVGDRCWRWLAVTAGGDAGVAGVALAP